jgi:hypothetical protein
MDVSLLNTQVVVTLTVTLAEIIRPSQRQYLEWEYFCLRQDFAESERIIALGKELIPHGPYWQQVSFTVGVHPRYTFLADSVIEYLLVIFLDGKLPAIEAICRTEHEGTSDELTTAVSRRPV